MSPDPAPKADAAAELAWEPTVDSAHIGVTDWSGCRPGQGGEGDRDLAVATAWAAPGTMTGENHIRIS